MVGFVAVSTFPLEYWNSIPKSGIEGVVFVGILGIVCFTDDSASLLLCCSLFDEWVCCGFIWKGVGSGELGWMGLMEERGMGMGV